jgi:AcrR family transcriptional regulator
MAMEGGRSPLDRGAPGPIETARRGALSGRTTVATRAPRRSADERREEIVGIALEHFALGGYHGTSTEAIAREAGISQPYLFRLFRTKRELFLACNERHCRHLEDVFRRAAEAAPPGEKLEAMGRAYAEQLLPDRHQLLFQMQAYAACSDPEIQAHVRHGYGELVRAVTELSGATAPAVYRFFAAGMMLNVITSLDLGAIADEDPWAAAWCDHERMAGLDPEC